MPREPVDIVHVNLRIRENLRRDLEHEAKKHQVSLNYEITSRLQQTFEQQHILYTHQLAESAGRMLLPLIEGGQDLNLQGDLIRAIETLITRHLLPLLAARVIDHYSFNIASCTLRRRRLRPVCLLTKSPGHLGARSPRAAALAL